MAVLDVRLVEIVPHVLCGVEVGKTVVGTGLHPIEADTERWQKDHIMQFLEARVLQEGLDEPGTDHTVVDDIAMSGQPPRGLGGGFDDSQVLSVCLRQPRWDKTLSKEGEEAIAFDEDTCFEPVSQLTRHG